ncbi:putative iron-regulated membrane protein [Algoriphagus sp. 4150]|uniref:PepSY-associated TM helix domain-containing protein n=1 Tax=Algoriphagus sp. 4150 TaxID=2817756 RepID=UPI00285E4EFF|nr:PepSY-associated TM helix domain-containing protein [Algoriphagus sp. 4150]MDR7130923.1 putative iron-regulated membrane protein [Algoriphagus sp. 4150]
MKFKKTLRFIHRWIGLITGALVFVISITGCLYSFYYEIQPLVYQDRMFVEVPADSARLPISTLLENASKAIDYKVPCMRTLIPLDPDETVAFIFQELDGDAFFYADYMKFYKTVYMNPYTGIPVFIEDTKWEFFNVIFWMHTTLFLGYAYGNVIVTWVVILFVVMMLTGLVLWWPKRKNLKKSLTFQWKSTTRWRRINYDLHQILGFYVLVLALLSALTGLFWASEKFNHGAQWLANGGKALSGLQLAVADSLPASSQNTLDLALASTLEAAPNTSVAMIRFVPSPAAPIIVRAYIGSEANFKREVYYYDKKTGQRLGVETFWEKNSGEKLAALNYDLHVGTILGMPGQIIAFLASLIIAGLSVTGPLIWYGRKK